MTDPVRRIAGLIPEIHLIRDEALCKAVARLWSDAPVPSDGAVRRVRGAARLCLAAAEALQEIFAAQGAVDRDTLLSAALAWGGQQATGGEMDLPLDGDLPEGVVSAATGDDSLEAAILRHAKALVGEVEGRGAIGR